MSSVCHHSFATILLACVHSGPSTRHLEDTLMGTSKHLKWCYHLLYEAGIRYGWWAVKDGAWQADRIQLLYFSVCPPDAMGDYAGRQNGRLCGRHPGRISPWLPRFSPLPTELVLLVKEIESPFFWEYAFQAWCRISNQYLPGLNGPQMISCHARYHLLAQRVSKIFIAAKD